MGWDGAGSYTRVHNFSADASSGIKILAARMDAEINDIASAIPIAWARNGQNVPTTDMPMGGRKFVNVGAPTSVGNFMRVREFIENAPIFMQDVESSADRISVSSQYFTSVSANQAPVDGTKIMVRVNSDKSSAVMYLDGHSANVEYQDGNRIAAAMVSGGIYELTYSSSDVAWKLPSPSYGRTPAEIAAGVTVVNYQHLEGYVLRYGNNTTPGTTVMTAAIQAANDVMEERGGGRVMFPGETLRTDAVILRSIGVSFIGAGRNATIIEAHHAGIIISCDQGAGATPIDDYWSSVESMTLKGGGAFTPSHAIYYRKLGFTILRDLEIPIGVDVGVFFWFVVNYIHETVANRADIGFDMYSTSTADVVSLGINRQLVFSENATIQFRSDGHGSYQNKFDTCSFFSAPAVSVDIVYASQLLFDNCTWEGNAVNSVKLRGGDFIEFRGGSQIDPEQLFDSATFGARNVRITNALEWASTTVFPAWLVNDEVTVRDPIYTLDEAAAVGQHESHYFTEGHHTTGRKFANFPGYADATAFHAQSHVSPYGGEIYSGAYNRVDSFDFSNAGQWATNQGTSGATDPLGGTSAYNMNSIAVTTHNANSLGSAATGRTFTFQVWAKYTGSVRLGIGTTTGSIQKFANYYSTTANWRLLSITYTSPTDTGTTPLLQIVTRQNTVMWRPCHYESFGPLPAIGTNVNLASVALPMRVEDMKIVTHSTAAPSAGAWRVGDICWNTAPAAGGTPGWVCTTAGTSGTWKAMAAVAA